MGSKYIQQFLDDNKLKCGEEFKIETLDREVLEGKFSIANDSLISITDNKYVDFILLKLLQGNLRVRKVKFPNYGDIYYYVSIKGFIEKARCTLDPHDLLMRQSGRIYQTKEEAICHQAVDMAYWINLENEVNK